MPENIEILNEIIIHRTKIAEILDYSNYAEYILERDKIIIGKEPSIEPQHHKTILNIEQEYSESAFYQTYEDRLNWSNPYGINLKRTQQNHPINIKGPIPKISIAILA